MPLCEKAEVVELVILIIWTEIVLKFFGYKSAQKMIFSNGKETKCQNSYLVMKHKAQLLTGICEGMPWEITCLRKSVALKKALARAGIASKVVLGVNRVDGKVVAHAWLECMGHSIFKSGEYFQMQDVAK
ncbi:MAG: lasso peptide biosynthesis B2 protein [Bacillota bacterium]